MGTFDWHNKAIMDHWFGVGDYDATNLRYLDRSPAGLHAGWVAGATAPAKLADRHGILCDGGDNLTGATQGKFNQSAIALCLQFVPTFAADAGGDRYLFDASNAARYLVLKGALNQLIVYFGNTNTLLIALAAFGPYWHVGCVNTLVVTGTTGDNMAMLNRQVVGTSATAWAAANPAAFWIGSNFGAGNGFLGNVLRVAAYPMRMTQIQGHDWSRESMCRVNDM